MNRECIGLMFIFLFKVGKTCTSEIVSTPFWGVQRGGIPLERGYKGVSPLGCFPLVEINASKNKGKVIKI